MGNGKEKWVKCQAIAKMISNRPIKKISDKNSNRGWLEGIGEEETISKKINR